MDARERHRGHDDGALRAPSATTGPVAAVPLGAPDTVGERLGDRVEELRIETGDLHYPVYSPAHFRESMSPDSGAIALALESVDAAALPAVDQGVIAALQEHFPTRWRSSTGSSRRR